MLDAGDVCGSWQIASCGLRTAIVPRGSAQGRIGSLKSIPVMKSLCQANNFAPRQGPMANETSKRDLNAEADEALEAARSMPNGPEKNEALKKAGVLRKAADDAAGITFAKRGRPRR